MSSPPCTSVNKILQFKCMLPQETDFANTNTDRRMRMLNYQCKPEALLTMFHNETPEYMMLLPGNASTKRRVGAKGPSC